MRQLVIEEVQGWLGTPFHPNARQKHAGCDCFGLILGVYEALGGTVPTLPCYTTNRQSLQSYQQELLRVLQQIARPGQGRVGEILLFGVNRMYLHCGIKSSEQSFIHCLEQQCVREARFSERWQRRLLGIYKFKDF